MPSPVFQSRVNASIFEAFAEKIEDNGFDQRTIIESMMVHFIAARPDDIRKMISDRKDFVQKSAESTADQILDTAKRDARGGRPKR